MTDPISFAVVIQKIWVMVGIRNGLCNHALTVQVPLVVIYLARTCTIITIIQNPST